MTTKKPNILLLFSDQHNAGVMGCAGNSIIKTPHLDELAASGVVYHRAYCQNGICMPSRTSMLLGKYCRTIGQYDNGIPLSTQEKPQPFVQKLHQVGYETAAFGTRGIDSRMDEDWDVAMSHSNYDLRLDGYYSEWVKERGQYDAYFSDMQAAVGGEKSSPICCKITQLLPENTKSAFTADKTIEFIRENKDKENPFFCWASFSHPHQPYTPLEEYVRMYDIEKMPLPETWNENLEHFSPFIRGMREREANPWCFAKANKDHTLWKRYIQYYYALVTEIDYQIGRIADTLRDEGILEDTLIIYTSDHGEFLGAHGLGEKMTWGHNVYEDTLRVPLLISWKTHIRAHQQSEELVELVDIYPTLMDICEIRENDKNALHGISLVENLMGGKSIDREYAVSENLIQFAVIGKKHKLGIWLKPEDTKIQDVLFEKASDPLECNNLIGKRNGVEERMRRFYYEWIEKYPAKKYDYNSQGTFAKMPGYFIKK